MKPSCLRGLASVVALFLSGTPGWAQTGAPLGSGFQPNRDYLALQPFEAIDTASGNLVLTFIDLELPGNAGRPLRFMRTFNNQVQHTDGLQWRFSLSGIPMIVEQPVIPPGTVISDDLNPTLGHWAYSPKFIMPDGSLLRTMFQKMTAPDQYRKTAKRIDRSFVTHTHFFSERWPPQRKAPMSTRHCNGPSNGWGPKAMGTVYVLRLTPTYPSLARRRGTQIVP